MDMYLIHQTVDWYKKFGNFLQQGVSWGFKDTPEYLRAILNKTPDCLTIIERRIREEFTELESIQQVTNCLIYI